MSKETNKCDWCKNKTNMPNSFVAMSPIQPKMEEKIQEAINMLTKNRTTLVIAHRLSTIMNSKNIYVINKGAVEAKGSHESLLLKSEIYKNFYEKQLKKN